MQDNYKSCIQIYIYGIDETKHYIRQNKWKNNLELLLSPSSRLVELLLLRNKAEYAFTLSILYSKRRLIMRRWTHYKAIREYVDSNWLVFWLQESFFFEKKDKKLIEKLIFKGSCDDLGSMVRKRGHFHWLLISTKDYPFKVTKYFENDCRE